MKEFIRKHIIEIVFSIAGATGGFLYWKFVGCSTGTCPIKSIWYMSTLWGVIFGYLCGSIISDLIRKFKNKSKLNDNVNAGQL